MQSMNVRRNGLMLGTQEGTSKGKSEIDGKY